MTIRPATAGESAALATLFGSVEEAILHRPSALDLNAVYDWLRTLALVTNTWVVEERGDIVAAAFAEFRAGTGTFAGAVHPSAWGRGLGGQLVDLAEARLAEEGAGRIHTWTVAGDGAAEHLFIGRGYGEVRRFWDMSIRLDEELPATDLDIHTFREEDAHAFHAALEDAFEDHWDHHPQTFDEWWSRHRERPHYDPSLWFFITDGDDVVAAIRNDLNVFGGGFVGALGVRRQWRGRGYGRALLLRSFAEFRRRGMSRVGLIVDASNPTGATRLYESVGMHVELETVVWERHLIEGKLPSSE